MKKCFANITDDLKDFILSQKMFFVGTAPNTDDKVHISPKGYDILKIINENKVIYLDYFGSENDTAQHLNQNGKITLMWYSFDSNQCILRAFGKGKVISKGTDDFNSFLNQYFNMYNEKIIRQIFEIEIHKLVTTCEFGVPIMKYEKDRDSLHKVSEAMLIKKLPIEEIVNKKGELLI